MEYTAKDLLILSQAIIHISEDAIEGVSHKTISFWDDVVIAFSKLKEQQEAYDSRRCKQDKYNKVLLQGEFLSGNDDDSVEVVVPVRTTSSLQQKWLKSVLHIVMKFHN